MLMRGFYMHEGSNASEKLHPHFKITNDTPVYSRALEGRCTLEYSIELLTEISS